MSGDHSAYAAFIRRILAAYSRRTASADPADLPELLALAATVSQAIDVAVTGLRESGFSWQEIGDATGTTRQAAHARWSSKMP